MIRTLLGLLLLSITPTLHAQEHEADAILIGGGIMSATLATLLHELNPELKIEIYERLGDLAFESSGTLNNAGTGHAALSELNYTPRKADGSIDISKAVQINEEFEISKQFWSYLASHGSLTRPQDFIHTVPHLSWVHGADNVRFLRDRFAALKQVSLFQDMQYSESPAVLKAWMPVIMQGRTSNEPMAATRSIMGTDVDYGKLTTLLFENVVKSANVDAYTSHEVKALRQQHDGTWRLVIKDLRRGLTKRVRAKFVFIGAGGGTLPLLQKSGLKEGDGYGGFPVGGEFLIYKGSALSDEHEGKVYGQAAVGAPPMSVPHLDTRVINGQKRLIFGPFAGATTRFLKSGSVFDLMQSVRVGNVRAMLEAGSQNVALVKYLIDQEGQSHLNRIQALREFIPTAQADDWELIDAGVRVQIIKRDPVTGKSALKFGTEVVTSADGSLAALLGASPGASTSVAAMLEVLNKSFAEQMNSATWKTKLGSMLPSYGKKLADDPALLKSVRSNSNGSLGLGGRSCRDLFEMSR